MTKNNLAIIIPAYKSSFLRETLDSILNQSCQDFNLYIGDDASPYDLKTILEEYESKIPFTYKKFEDNLGGKDLVSQWERCINLSKDEEWIWLFSDDDLMGRNCVKEFYKTIESGIKNIDKKVLRFNRYIINQNQEVIPQNFEMPREYDIQYLMQKQIEGKFGANLTEHLFSRKLYTEMGGYVKFPLAWGSDGVTFMKYGEKYGFVTLPEIVYWRSSGENLSTLKMYDVKLKAEKQINRWLYDFLGKYKGIEELYKGQIRLRFEIIIHYMELSFKDLWCYCYSLKTDLKVSKLEIFEFVLKKLIIWKLKFKLKKLLINDFQIIYKILCRPNDRI